MKVERIIVGKLATNCYFVIDDKTCLIVDPGADYQLINDYIKKQQLKVVGILITHYHFDHTLALDKLLKATTAKVYDFHDLGFQKTAGFTFEVIATLGHTADSVSFYFKNIQAMFVGDFIFKEDIGRCDLPTGDFKQMLKSLKYLKNFPVITVLYPGHGEQTTLELELKNNKYLGEV